jgi:hypothetical protein
MVMPMGDVVELQSARKRKTQPTLAELIERVRALSDDSWNISFNPKLRGRMAHRGKTMRDILETLKKGEGVRGPEEDAYGKFKIRLRRCVCGKRTQVDVLVGVSDLSVIAVL